MAKRKSKATLNEPKAESHPTAHSDAPAARSSRKAPKATKPEIRIRREGDSVIVSVPVTFYRRNGRQMVLAQTESDIHEANQTPNRSKSEVASHSNTTLVSAIAKAYQWQEHLESGQFETIEDLADSKKVCRGFAARIMRLTSLSPKVIELILKGEAAQSQSLRQLHKGIPNCWKEQEDLLVKGSHSRRTQIRL